MLNKIKNIWQGKDAFSAAEMLLVMLIISFLILAMPPLVHKKFEKKITRGEHGRYECWKEGSTVYEYRATEKNGPVESSMIDTATHTPKGRPASGNICRFNPKTDAPDASFFSIQVVGGGAGGSYPPFDGSTTYMKIGANMSKDVNLEHRSYDIKTDSGDYSGPSKQYSYVPWLKFYDSSPETTWVRKYFPPVKSKVAVQWCAGSGHRGDAYVMGGTSEDIEGAVMYGGQGQSAFCFKATSGKLVLTNSDSSYYQAYSTVELNDYPNSPGGNSIQFNPKALTSDKWKEIDFIAPDMCYYSYKKGTTYSTSTIEAVIDSTKTSETWPNPQIRSVCSPQKDSSVVCTQDCSKCDDYKLDYHVHSDYMYTSTTTTDTIQTGDITIDQGLQGASYDPERDALAPTTYALSNCLGANSISNPFACPTVGHNRRPTYSGPAMASVKATDLFPSTISMVYTYDYNTPTYGYAGKPGRAASLLVPKLSGEVQITLGDGGAAGTKGSTSQRKGANGGSTVVWIKDENAPSSTVCSSANNYCRYVLTGNGGLGMYGGASGSQIKLLGADTCDAYGNTSIVGKLHRCLDRGVALYSEAEMRFSTDSGFAAIPEFDSRTKTPSAINQIYKNSSLKPGSGGDGGYSFIINNSGQESIQARNHTYFTPASIKKMGTGLNDFVSAGTSKIKRTRSATVTSTSSEVTGYKCFEKEDVGSFGTGSTPVDYSGLAGKVKVCLPKAGQAGAVVIIW